MTYEKFLKIMLSLQKESRVITEAYKINIDLIEFVDPYHAIISSLIKELYGVVGHEWWEWYCWENDFGQKGLEANDAKGNPICYSWETLYQQMEIYRKEHNVSLSN